MTPVDKVAAIEEARGYVDIDPENLWQAFLECKASMANESDLNA